MNTDYKIFYTYINGKRRKIVTYKTETKRDEHLEIKDFLDENLIFSKFTKAYIAHSSIYKNAKAHMYNDVFLKYDIEKFFNNINHKLLVELLHEQLNVGYEEEKYSLLEVSDLVGNCVIGRKGLPLGLITSPSLANIYLKTFDNIFYGKLKMLGLENIIYTRYADDLTISFKNPNNLDLEEFNDTAKLILDLLMTNLRKYKLKLNMDKKNMVSLKLSNHVRITGVSIIRTVDGRRRLSVGKKRIMKLYDDALDLYHKKKNESYVFTDVDSYNINRIKGMESFILSIHKQGYNDIFSNEMRSKIHKLGFDTLHDLISSLD